jgi:hypothetical protein
LGVKENISIGVEKYINGEKLTANELRTVNWMKQEIADLQRIYENSETARLLDDQHLEREQVIETAYMADNEISRQGLQRSDHLEVQEAALAARLDENAFDAAVKKHEGDDAGFRAEVRRIIYEKQGAQSSGGGEGHQPGAVAQEGSDSVGQRLGAGGRAEPRQADQAATEAVGREAAGTKLAAETAGTLKKAPDAIETAARKAVETNPDALVPNPETGALTSVKQLMTDAEAIYQQQVKESVAYKAAVNCFVGH